MKFQYLVKQTKSEVMNTYLQIILGHGYALGAYGFWYETVTTEHRSN